MEVILFRALTSTNVDPDTAQRVVDALEEHIDVAIGQANKGLESKLDGMKASMDAYRMSVEQTRVWLIIITSIIAIAALFGPIMSGIAQFVKH